MATLSENSDSWAASGIIRRDFRAAKDAPEVPGARNRGRKNTKRWCKGKVGREHDVRSVNENFHACHRDCSYLKENGGSGYHPWNMNRIVTKCVNCGMDRWNLHKSYKTDPIQEKLARKWCDKGHLYDWLTAEERAKLHSPKAERDWWDSRCWARSGRNYYEYETCVMCGKTARTRRNQRA